MPIDRYDNYSDLDFARHLTRRLMRTPGADRELPVAPPRYVRFLPAASAPDAKSLGFTGSWNELLEACMLEVDAVAAFVMGEEGLVVAVQGAIGADEAQGMGARLMIGLAQAEQLNRNGSGTTICAEVGQGWVSALSFVRDEARLLLAVVGAAPLDSISKGVVAQLLEQAFRQGTA